MLSISIVTYQLNSSLFSKLLDSLAEALNYLPTDKNSIAIKIIDNGNQMDKIKNLVKNYIYSNELEIVSGHNNVGYGKGHNLAINTCNSKYHLILNPDVVLDKKSLLIGIQYLDTNLDCGVVCPSCTNENGEIQYLIKEYPSVMDLFLRGLGIKQLSSIFSHRLAKYEMKTIVDSENIVSVEIISGCFMLCRTSLLKQIGGFDERYFLYFEDFALSLELGKLGKVIYLPSMKIIHFGGDAARKGIKHIVMFVSSGIKFFNQYGWKVI